MIKKKEKVSLVSRERLVIAGKKIASFEENLKN